MKRLIATLFMAMLIAVALICSVNAYNPGDPIGWVYNSDVLAYIDGYPIKSYNINWKTYVVAEDLLNYGFNVEWRGDEKMLIIHPEHTTLPENYTTTYEHTESDGVPGTPAMEYIYTDITTWIGDTQVESYNISGNTCVCMDDLATYFAKDYVWDADSYELRMAVEYESSLCPDFNHNFNIYTVEPTCTQLGYIRFNCIDCGYYFVDYLGYGHDYDGYDFCRICGERYVIDPNRNQSDIDIASSVEWISQRKIWYDDANGCFVLVFALLDENNNEVDAPAVVNVEIENDNGEVVYDTRHIVTTDDYDTWYYNNGTVSHRQATIYIYDWEFIEGTTDSGKVHFTVYNDGYFYFDESVLSISSNLPKIDLAEMCTLTLPELPNYIYDKTRNDLLTTKITDISYTFEETYNGNVELSLSFTGERIDFDVNQSMSKICKIAWKLLDEDGFVVDSGIVYTPTLKPGDKFKNVTESIYSLSPGNYTLEILDIVN